VSCLAGVRPGGGCTQADDPRLERGQGWLGYCWAPTAILGKYEMVKLDAGVPHDPAQWNSCNAKADCADPKKTDWAVSLFYTGVTDRFKKAGGPAYDYLTRRGWSNQTVGSLMAWMTDNQATGKDGALRFLKSSPQVWEAWVSPEAAGKIRAAL
jgi:glycine betaine/proline transport system substrate-binding protein